MAQEEDVDEAGTEEGALDEEAQPEANATRLGAAQRR